MNDFIQELAVRSFLIAAFGLTVRLCLHKASAAAKANVLMVTLITLVLLPFAQLLQLRVPVEVGVVEVTRQASAAASAPVAETPWHFVWIAVAALFTAKIAWSWIAFRRLTRQMSPAESGLRNKVAEITSRKRQVLFSTPGLSPMTWGLLRPKIALPQDSAEWDEIQLRSVVLHEDAHIRRADWAVSMGYQVVTALYWFNPLVWALRSLYEKDSEQAADDWVLSQGMEAPAYAERLLMIAKSVSSGGVRLPVVTVLGPSDLKGRLQSILDARVSRSPLSPKARATVLSCLTSAGLASSLLMPVVTQRWIEPTDPPSAMAISDDGVELESSDKWDNFEVTAPIDINVNTPAVAKVSMKAGSVTLNGPKGEQMKMTSGARPKIEFKGGSVIAPPADCPPNAPESAEEKDPSDFEEGMKDFHEGMKEAEESLKEASKDIEKSIKEAMDEVEKSMGSEFEKKMAQESVKLAAEIAKGSIQAAADSLKGPKTKKKDPPKSPASPDKQK